MRRRESELASPALDLLDDDDRLERLARIRRRHRLLLARRQHDTDFQAAAEAER